MNVKSKKGLLYYEEKILCFILTFSTMVMSVVTPVKAYNEVQLFNQYLSNLPVSPHEKYYEGSFNNLSENIGITGLVAYRICDFDYDGQKELMTVVIDWEKSDEYGFDYEVFGNAVKIQIFEISNGNVVKSDEKRINNNLASGLGKVCGSNTTVVLNNNNIGFVLSDTPDDCASIYYGILNYNGTGLKVVRELEGAYFVGDYPEVISLYEHTLVPDSYSLTDYDNLIDAKELYMAEVYDFNNEDIYREQYCKIVNEKMAELNLNAVGIPYDDNGAYNSSVKYDMNNFVCNIDDDWYIEDYNSNSSINHRTVITVNDVPVAEENPISVILNGTVLSFDQPPVIIDGRTLVPLRAIFEAMGATVDWVQATQSITSIKSETTIRLSIGSNVLYKNDMPIYLDVPAQIINDRTMVPVRAIAEAFGADVTWDGDARTVYIDINQKTHGIIIYADEKFNEIAANSFREILQNNKLGVNEQDIHCRLEPDEDEYNQLLSIVRQNANTEDITYFFYAGHGDDEGGIYPDYNSDNHTDTYMRTPTQLIDDLNEIPGTIVIILESCHSGCIQNTPNLNLDKFKIITSSQENQYSDTDHQGIMGIIKNRSLGAFSEAFLNGLGGLEGNNFIYNTLTGRDGKAKADYNNDSKVTLAELFEYISDNMDQEYYLNSKEDGILGAIYYQNPTCSNPNDQTVIYAY